MAAAEDIEEQARNHADAGRAEAPMPAVEFAQRAADEGRQKPADIDADIIDIIGPGVARIARLVKIADLGRDGGQEKAVADHDHRQPGVERSEEQTSELQSLMCISYAVFCLKK